MPCCFLSGYQAALGALGYVEQAVGIGPLTGAQLVGMPDGELQVPRAFVLTLGGPDGSGAASSGRFRPIFWGPGGSGATSSGHLLPIFWALGVRGCQDIKQLSEHVAVSNKPSALVP